MSGYPKGIVRVEIVDDEAGSVLLGLFPYGGEADVKTPQEALRKGADSWDRNFWFGHVTSYRQARSADVPEP